ncbi:DUF3742 family protein [Pseudomonas koreensis]|uniref:DUF3742 family protein n=1 Tax=Pseudomonas koreensis TaxID=198620 RepID=A0A9X2XF03_9PSED|nr:DUF3742 family protein [Pseudomonas koreensis]MCU7247304.1 DUF3742 family protein [Pseudomonas koreensis]
MSSKDRDAKASRTGIFLGRCWKGYLRFLNALTAFIVKIGAPPALAHALGVLLQAVALIALLYVAFWLTIFLLILFITCNGLLTREPVPSGWRDGPNGYGYYQEGIRIDYGRLFDDD